MAQPLRPINIASPGFKGLNKQSQYAPLDQSWAIDASNCVFDSFGRISSRKGYTTTYTPHTTGTIRGVFQQKLISGSTYVFSAANNEFRDTAATLLYNTSITADNWQYVNFNNFGWLFQEGHAPLRQTSGTIVTIASLGGTGTPPQGDCVHAAYGRLWVGRTSTDKTTLYYSDTLIGQNWSGGAAGSLDLKSVWTLGMDEITAISSFNGYLIIFGKSSILIYSGPTNPATMVLVENITGVGCIARDSVQDIGTDLLFLSNSGLRSLSRVIQEKSLPQKDISKNVRDDLLLYVGSESTKNNIKSVYSKNEGFYLLSLPSSNIVYCFDIRRQLEDGTYPVTSWNTITPTAFLNDGTTSLLFGKNNTIATYTGYKDNGTNSYVMSFSTPWLDFESPNFYKILKKIITTISGASGVLFTTKWGFDYSGLNQQEQANIPVGSVAEYGIAEYGIAEYSNGIVVARNTAFGLGIGKVVAIGFSSTINGAQIGLQKIEVYAKAGREI